MINWHEKYHNLLEILEDHSRLIKQYLEHKDYERFKGEISRFIELIDEEVLNMKGESLWD